MGRRVLAFSAASIATSTSSFHIQCSYEMRAACVFLSIVLFSSLSAYSYAIQLFYLRFLMYKNNDNRKPTDGKKKKTKTNSSSCVDVDYLSSYPIPYGHVERDRHFRAVLRPAFLSSHLRFGSLIRLLFL